MQLVLQCATNKFQMLYSNRSSLTVNNELNCVVKTKECSEIMFLDHCLHMFAVCQKQVKLMKSRSCQFNSKGPLTLGAVVMRCNTIENSPGRNIFAFIL